MTLGWRRRLREQRGSGFWGPTTWGFGLTDWVPAERRKIGIEEPEGRTRWLNRLLFPLQVPASHMGTVFVFVLFLFVGLIFFFKMMFKMDVLTVSKLCSVLPFLGAGEIMGEAIPSHPKSTQGPNAAHTPRVLKCC